jgi:hypothetical protein
VSKTTVKETIWGTGLVSGVLHTLLIMPSNLKIHHRHSGLKQNPDAGQLDSLSYQYRQALTT